MLVFNACSPSTQEQDNCLALAIIYDTSLSAVTNGVPALDTAHVTRIVRLLQKHGGAIAFGDVGVSKKNVGPLHRLRLHGLEGLRLDERARLNKENIGAIQAFRHNIDTIVKQGRSAKLSDIYGALEKVSIFLNEPAQAIIHNRIILFASDGLHDATSAKTPPDLPGDLQVFTVGTKPDLARKIFLQGPIIFGSLDAALDHLENSLEK
jgi:hypothetical protein